MLKILQGRLQQYMNQEPPDVQADFNKGRGTRDQIANIRWIIEKAREFQKNICFKHPSSTSSCRPKTQELCARPLAGETFKTHGLCPPRTYHLAAK